MITVNLYYIGINGNARRFAEEMESNESDCEPLFITVYTYFSNIMMWVSKV